MMTNSAITNNPGKNHTVSRRWIFKNIPIAFLAVLVVLVTTQSSQARIGFTKEQCDAQYGPSIKEWNDDGIPPKRILYLKNDVKIYVGFYPSRLVVDSITYRVEGEITAEQQKILLELNSEGGDWSITRDKPHDYKTGTILLREWSSTKGGRATYESENWGKEQSLWIKGSFIINKEAEKKKASEETEKQQKLKQVEGL